MNRNVCVPLEHMPGDVFSIRRLRHRQRTAVGQTRPPPSAASVHGNNLSWYPVL